MTETAYILRDVKHLEKVVLVSSGYHAPRSYRDAHKCRKESKEHVLDPQLSIFVSGADTCNQGPRVADVFGKDLPS